MFKKGIVLLLTLILLVGNANWPFFVQYNNDPNTSNFSDGIIRDLVLTRVLARDKSVAPKISTIQTKPAS